MFESACRGQLIADVIIHRKKNVFVDLMLGLVLVDFGAGIYRTLLLSLKRFLAKTLFNDNAINSKEWS